MNRTVLVLLLSLLLASFSSSQSEPDQLSDDSKDEQYDAGLKQQKKDLLAGVSRSVCYSGYRSGQHPDRGDGAKNPSYEDVLEDLTILSSLSNFKLIRLYDSGENSELVLRVIHENQIDIRVMLGIWLKAELSNHETCSWLTEPIPEDILQKNKSLNSVEIERGIKLANQFKEIVIAVNVGNEALVDWNDHKVDPDTIITYVKYVRQSVKQEVTVAENYKWWSDQGSALSKEVDFLAIHVYPLWEGKGIDEGLSYTIENVKEVREAFPDKKIVISEAGWASRSSEFGEQTSQKNQLRYFNELMAWSDEMNITTFFFEAFDEDWKGDPGNPMGAEKHWGLYTIDREPKKVVLSLSSK